MQAMQSFSVLDAFPTDVIFGGVLFISLVIFGFAGGRRFIVSFVVSLYVAFAAAAAFPSFGTFVLRFGVSVPQEAKAIVFLVVLFLATWLLAGTALTAAFRFSLDGIRDWWQIVVSSALATGLFGALFFSAVPKSVIAPSTITQSWLLADPFPFLWVLAPVIFFSILSAREE